MPPFRAGDFVECIDPGASPCARAPIVYKVKDCYEHSNNGSGNYIFTVDVDAPNGAGWLARRFKLAGRPDVIHLPTTEQQ